MSVKVITLHFLQLESYSDLLVKVAIKATTVHRNY